MTEAGSPEMSTGWRREDEVDCALDYTAGEVLPEFVGQERWDRHHPAAFFRLERADVQLAVDLRGALRDLDAPLEQPQVGRPKG
jgi:hypothetical protein